MFPYLSPYTTESFQIIMIRVISIKQLVVTKEQYYFKIFYVYFFVHLYIRMYVIRHEAL